MKGRKILEGEIGKGCESMKTVDILGVQVASCTLVQAREAVFNMLQEDKLHMVLTPNSEIVMLARKNKPFQDILNQADLCTADGIGVVYGAKLLGTPIPERVAGFDLLTDILQHGEGISVYLFGSKPGVADKAKEEILHRFTGIEIAGVQNGYFDEKQEQAIIADIREKKPDILLVCLGAPKQEKWIWQHRKELGAKVAMGLGGSLDVLAGEVKRAPKIFIKLGLEWLYRLMKEPKRIIRMMALPHFLIVVLKEKWIGGKR